MIDGGWEKFPSGGWFPVLRRVVRGRVHEVHATYLSAPAEPYYLQIDGVRICEGTLSEVLEAATGYDT